RSVDWNRFEPNFFAVFPSGSLDAAPKSFILLGQVEDEESRSAFKAELIRAAPAAAVLDLTRVRGILEGILRKVRQIMRFLAAFCAAAGALVLAASLATSRIQRMRESALLKTLGARRGQLLRIYFAEYLTLGSLSALTGLVLAWGASWLWVHFVMRIPLVVALPEMMMIWAGVPLLTLGVGLLSSRGLLTRPPLATLRDAVG
ncbi:FtsX-like permease family protein, partial [Gemmatimonadota bacterium]